MLQGKNFKILSVLTAYSFLMVGCESPYEIQSALSNLTSTTASPSPGPVTVVPPVTPISPVSPIVPADPVPTSTPNSDLCVANPTAAACNKTPTVTSAGVVTILFTVSQIPQGAATLILANAIKYASPAGNPKILFVKDYDTGGEDEGDVDYIKNTLLQGYNITYEQIPVTGLSATSLVGKDLVIVSNPGFPLSNVATLNTLKAFGGGVILMGDDMSYGVNFSMDSFTGLTFKSNGTALSCGGHTYQYDNNAGYSYQVSINDKFLPGIPDADQNYTYGNDLDNTVALPGTEILAYATAAAGTCDIGQIPAIARHVK